MLDTASGGRPASAINVTSSQTLNAALRGFADASSDGIVQISTGGAEYLSGSAVKDPLVVDASALAKIRARGRGPVPHPRGPAHRPLPEGQARQLHAPAGGHLRQRVQHGQEPLFQSPHVGRLGVRRRTWRSPANCSSSARPPGSSWRWRSAWSAARRRHRRRDQREAVHPRRTRWPRRGAARLRRARPVHPGRDVRQRARRLQAGAREAAPDRAQGDPGRGRPEVRPAKPVSTSSSTAGPGRPSRRSGKPSATAWSR